MLDQRIGGHGRPVAEIGNVAGQHRALPDPADDRMRGIGRSRGTFQTVAGAFLEQADIGKSAAGIDADPPRHWSVSASGRFAGDLALTAGTGEPVLAEAASRTRRRNRGPE